MSPRDPRTKARIRSLLWDSIHRHGWRDEDDFTLRLADRVFSDAREISLSGAALSSVLIGIRTNFFTVNKLSKSKFVDVLEEDLVRYIPGLIAASKTPLRASDVFPETVKVGPLPSNVRQALNLPERLLQNHLREILDSKGASPMPARERDTAQEVADIEWFRMHIRGASRSFAVVVKGFRSVSGNKLTWEHVAHQVTKAYRATPDHIMLVTAKEPTDGLLTHLQEYSESVGNPDLIVFVAPGDLWRVLKAHRFL